MTIDADRDRLVELNEDFYAAFEAGDLDAMEAVWVDGDLAASVTCVHPGWPVLRGRDEVMRSWAMIMANTTYIQFVLTDVEVEVGTDFAVLTCVENILTAAEDEDDGGDESAFAGAKGVATNVFRRRPEGWRLWVRHGSPVISDTSDDED
ncbi:MAG TPA: nuclear transport factor 2 family protein [Sporichthya sp.]|jgi:ketosteroid isomerase-like protein|nr:nuclear transport factor 2 family protein [Sporichthya sp.]